MNIRHKGRTYSDSPAILSVVNDNYTIPTVSIKVSKKSPKGRTENYTNSRPLMNRLDMIGARKFKLLGLAIDGKWVGSREAQALHLYLQAGSGLKYFRRSNMLFWHTREALNALLSNAGIQNHVTRSQSSDQVPAGYGDAPRSLSLIHI